MDQLLDYILHFDAYLTQAVEALGLWAYLAIFATIFAETGLVVAPFLPGESLLLASGTLAGAGVLHIAVLWPLLVGAAFLGDVVNYLIGRWLGRHLLSKPRKYLKPEHVQEAHEFYEEHGGLAIVACRFLPIVRTLVPFVAGVTQHGVPPLPGLRRPGRRPLGDDLPRRRLPLRQHPVGAGLPRRRAGDRRRRVGHPRLHHLGPAPPAPGALRQE